MTHWPKSDQTKGVVDQIQHVPKKAALEDARLLRRVSQRGLLPEESDRARPAPRTADELFA